MGPSEKLELAMKQKDHGTFLFKVSISRSIIYMCMSVYASVYCVYVYICIYVCVCVRACVCACVCCVRVW